MNKKLPKTRVVTREELSECLRDGRPLSSLDEKNDVNEVDGYDFRSYAKSSPEERLRMLRDAWKASKKDRQRAFFEGQMIEITFDMSQHPDWFDHPCMCEECRAYGE